MTYFLNDSAISEFDEDLYGISPFAKSLAKSISEIQSPIGTCIALNGPWGTGKSSAVNLLKRHLKDIRAPNLSVTDFVCWWYRGDEALALAFMQHLHKIFERTFGQKVKDLMPKIGRGLLQAGPVVGAAATASGAGPFGALIAPSFSFARWFFPKGKTLEETFESLAKILEKGDTRFLVIIDDIDRLTPEEALAVFRLVKSVGRLPNVIYLLVFDRNLADSAVEEAYPSEGSHFLEKIIQASFELPLPLQTDLNSNLLNAIGSVCTIPKDEEERLHNAFYDTAPTYLTSPRHVVRFENAIRVTWAAIAGEINVTDFFVLETLRLYEPSVFRAIRARKQMLCGNHRHRNTNFGEDTIFAPFLRDVDASKHDSVRTILQRLFPRLENMEYDSRFLDDWDAARRVCIERHFDTYFRLSLTDEVLPINLITELTSRADDQDFVKSKLLEASRTKRQNGSSLVPVYLDELNTHARNIEKSKVSSFLSALFQIHDDIDLDEDEGRGFDFGNTSLRYHWLIRRITEDRFSIEERTRLYTQAIDHASLAWLVDFTCSAADDYWEHVERPQPEDRCLVAEGAIAGLVDHALLAIRTAAQDGSLQAHNKLAYLLFRWRDLCRGDSSEVRTYTDNLLEDEKSLVTLAHQFTGFRWVQTVGERVARREAIARINRQTDIVDVAKFRQNVAHLLERSDLDADSRETLQIFVEAWNRRENDEL